MGHRRSIAGSLALATAALLSACKSGPTATGTGAGGAGRTATTAPAPVAERPLSSDPRSMRLQRVDMLVTQWDAAQADGRMDQADALFQRVGAEVDGDFALFSEAAEGRHGVQHRYLGVSALGFSRNPEATRLLIAQLGEADPRLVGNALIALKLRADPETPLSPILALIPSRAPEPRRYAPLVLAHVFEARLKAGRRPDPGDERSAMTLLSGVVADRDPYVRLHVAKALGALPSPASRELLHVLLADEHLRIRVAAAAALQKHGDPKAVPAIIRVLAEAPDESKPIVRDVLVSFAERLERRPLSPPERERLGVSARAWQTWFVDYARRSNIPLESVDAPRRVGPAATAPGAPTAPGVPPHSPPR